MLDEAAIRRVLMDLLAERGEGKSICPSEVARRLSPDDWRDLMPAVREVGRALADRGALRVTQRGELVDPRAAKGPIRYTLPEGA